MKENELTTQDEREALALRLQERALLMAGRAAAGDRLVLADATLLAALAGTRVLTPNERAALAASPLTLRRLRQLSLQGQAADPIAEGKPVANSGVASTNATRAGGGASANAASGTGTGVGSLTGPVAANDADWSGSAGMLRAASTAPEALASLVTDDKYWTLHFVVQDGGWQVILALSAQAPFAARLLGEQPLLRVIDGAGATVLQGQLDADGECECAWPFATAPAPHFQLHGAGFTVQPAPPAAR